MMAATMGALALASCGALLAFVLSPGQALAARRMARMPFMDAGAVAAAASGTDVLITGRLSENPSLGESDFVAYKLDRWVVTPADPADPEDQPSGAWEAVEVAAPELRLNVEDGTIVILKADGVTLGGPLRETLVLSEAQEGAEDSDGEWIPDGSLRYRGFLNADLITVLGRKASTGGVIPEEIYAGDRVSFIESKQQAARGMFFAGLCLLGFSPLVLVGGALRALFRRRR